LTTLRERTSSLAMSLAEAVSPRLAASLMDFLTFNSSVWI
jgi:hypothetical protein